MSRICFLFLLFFIGSLLEILCSSLGFRLILLVPMVFYTTYVYGTRSGIFAAVLSGMCCDFSTGLAHPWSIIGLLAAVLFAFYWLRLVDSYSFLLIMIPGFLLPLPALLVVPLCISGFSAAGLIDSLSLAFVVGLFEGLLFPLFIIVMDFLSSLFGFGTFEEARLRYQQEQLGK